MATAPSSNHSSMFAPNEHVIMVVFESGERDTINVTGKETGEEFVAKICQKFTLSADKIEKIVYLFDDDCLLTFPPNLIECVSVLVYTKIGDFSKIFRKDEEVKTMADLERYYEIHFNTNGFWKMLIAHPEFYKSDGLIYNHLANHAEKKLVDGEHYTFMNIVSYAYVYNKAADRFDICINHVGHFDINPQVEAEIRDCSLVNELTIANAMVNILAPPTTPYSPGVIRYKKGGYIVCYFLENYY